MNAVKSSRASAAIAANRGARAAARRTQAAARRTQAAALASLPPARVIMPALHEVLAHAVRAAEADAELGVIRAVNAAAKALSPRSASTAQVRDLAYACLCLVTAQPATGLDRLRYAHAAAALPRAQVGVTIIASRG